MSECWAAAPRHSRAADTLILREPELDRPYLITGGRSKLSRSGSQPIQVSSTNFTPRERLANYMPHVSVSWFERLDEDR